jgi:Ca2+-binding EF-hand superfamily protein
LAQVQLKQLFMKIDADSNGSVDWDEFTNFMFLKRQTGGNDPTSSSNSVYMNTQVSPYLFTASLHSFTLNPEP